MIFCYRATITSEPQELPVVKPKYGEARLSCPSGNAGAVYLSGSPVDTASSTLRYSISAAKDFPLKIDNLSQLYVFGTSGDYLDIICQIEDKDYEVAIKAIRARKTMEAR